LRIVEGLDLPIEGAPEQVISEGARAKTVALVGADYIGLRPRFAVREGDRVQLGQALFADKKHRDILFTSPGSGVVKEVNRGARRALLSVVVELDGTDEESFSAWVPSQLATLRSDQVIDNLRNSGLWTALRARPFGGLADPSTAPSSIFVTATDSNPLAAKPEVVIGACGDDFLNGLKVVARLADAPVFLCHAPDLRVPEAIAANVSPVAFSGPHPSGLVGTHVHFLDPVGLERSVWHIGYQDVIAIGALFTTGRLRVERIISLAGPQLHRPRLIRTALGASTDELTGDELREGKSRTISGSVLSGRLARGKLAYLGRYHNQVCVIAEGRLGETRGWLPPRRGKAFSAYRLPRFPGSQRPRFAMTTALHGEKGPLYPLGGFERVMPLDILPTPLLRALLVQDLETAQSLGCLELEEEDLALCSFVCPGKCDYGALLRSCLESIEKGE
jgi:Na+-transporting NADH:ubiquinone oxidoreductase subunit A